MKQELQKKVDRAICFLQSIPNDNPIEVAYSGGKDSDVILELTRMAGINYRAIYRNTSIDPPGTLRHVKDMGVEIREPKKTFLQILKERGFPSRFARFCCSILKEYKILDKAIVGIRRDESHNRRKRYKEPEMCRVYSAKEKAIQYYPILDWTLNDVEAFLNERGITCAPVYYDEKGVFHSERRLGCMCCPLASMKHRIAEFKEHPNMVKLYCRGGQKWLDNHKDSRAYEKFGDTYSFFVRTVFFKTDREYREAKESMFGEVDCKQFLEDYFSIQFAQHQ